MKSFFDCSHSLFAVILLLSFVFSTIDAQYPKKEKFHAVNGEVKYVRCETCQKAVKYLYRKTREMRDKAPAKKVRNYAIKLRALLQGSREF